MRQDYSNINPNHNCPNHDRPNHEDRGNERLRTSARRLTRDIAPTWQGYSPLPVPAALPLAALPDEGAAP